MKQSIRLLAAIAVVGMMLLMCTGCAQSIRDRLFESDDYRAYKSLAESVAEGGEFDKEDVVHEIGEPRYYDGKQDGVDPMTAEVTSWSYEEFDATGYPWRLVVNFDGDGNVTSAEFYAAPGG